MSLIEPIILHLSITQRDEYLIISSFQSCLVFIFPSYITALLCSNSATRYLGLSNPISIKNLIGIILLLSISTPPMNLLIDWNANVSFPESLSDIEHSFRQMEQSAEAITQTMLSDTSVWGLISGILVIGILTGFSEELFFRGGIQKTLISSGSNPHIAIWISAFVFSTLHFQFFGFIPRLLLGALFGYLYYSTKSIWVNASAHALNNSIVVIMSWLEARNLINFEPDKIGITTGTFPFEVILGSILTVIFIKFAWKYFFSPKNQNHGRKKLS